MANFDLAAMALKAVCPTNDILYDDKGLPSVMVKIPKFKISQVIPGGACRRRRPGRSRRRCRPAR